jgi:spermidine/putrescine-binding protein
MQRLGIIIATALGLALAAAPARAQTLNLVTAGDQNMVDYARDFLAPIFEKEHPGVTVKAIGTGPADAGSQKIMEKLAAEKANAIWDMDVVVIHQKAAGEMVKDGLLARYAPDVPTDKLVTSQTAKQALGVDVNGYVMPMFLSQTAIAYNTTMVKDLP